MLTYNAAKEKGGRWYVYFIETPGVPINGTFRKDKKEVMHIAANYNGISYKDFLKERKKLNCED